MKKLAMVVLSLVLLCSMVFAQAAAEANSGKTTIRVLNYIDMSEPNSANEIAQIWDKFSAEHPEIEVIREDLFNEPFHQKVEAYAAQGNLPDVMYAWPSGRSETLHKDGYLYNLKSLLERDGLDKVYSATSMADQAGKVGYVGELPNGLTATSMMFVNTKVLRENGLEMPKTYADLVAMVPVLNAKGIEVVSMDCKDAWVMQSCLFSLITGRFGGADWADRVFAGETDFADEWFVKSLTAVDNLYKDGVINRNTLSIGYGSGRGDFANGKSAFYIDGDWACASFQTDVTTGQALFAPEAQKTDIELINFPAFDGEVIHESNSAVVGTGWAIAADIDADKLEAAWTLVKFLESEYAQTWRLTTGASFPSLTTIDVAKVCEEYNLEPLVAKRSDWYNNIQVATPVIDGVLPAAVFEVINTVLQEIGLGSTTVEKGVADVNAAWHAYIGK
ncbi:MAG: extracellular solute-binding protein [Sphaerochaetaceae bacterium]|nr:extracellular solute-binding protein [Sphaerochaetaceae bacterium]